MSTTETQPQGVIPPLTLNVRMRLAREYAGLDQRGLAAAIGVPNGTYSNWESGSSSPRSRDLVAVAQRLQSATGVSALWLLGLVNQDGQPIAVPQSSTRSKTAMTFESECERGRLGAFAEARARRPHYVLRSEISPSRNDLPTTRDNRDTLQPIGARRWTGALTLPPCAHPGPVARAAHAA